MFQYWISIAYTTAKHSTVERIGIDETSSKKGHNYVTLAVDLDEHKVINAQVGKDANTIKSHWSGIVNFIQTRISNGILEGINSKIQLAKKRARGYRNMQNLIAMI